MRVITSKNIISIKKFVLIRWDEKKDLFSIQYAQMCQNVRESSVNKIIMCILATKQAKKIRYFSDNLVEKVMCL